MIDTERDGLGANLNNNNNRIFYSLNLLKGNCVCMVSLIKLLSKCIRQMLII